MKLAGRHGVSRTAAALKLDYYALKKRVEQQPAPAVSVAQPPAQPAFVDLALGRLAAGQCLIEIQERLGRRCGFIFPQVRFPTWSLWGVASGTLVMLQITPQMRILVAVEPVDFRKGIDGLAQLCRQALGEDPFRRRAVCLSQSARRRR